MSFEGYGLQEKLKQIWDQKVTGTLACEIKGFDKCLYVKDGIVCFATSTDPDDKLPNVLIRQGRFTEEQFENAEPNFNDALSVGRNLVEIGLITQQELVSGAKEQINFIFASCMQTDRGQVDFKEGPLPDGIVSLPLQYPRDFIRAIIEMNDKEWIADQFGGGLEFIPSHAKPIDFGVVDVGDWAKPLYELIDGELSFNHLAFESDVDDFLLLKFLYALKFLGHLNITLEEEEPEPEVDDIRDDLSQVMEEREELEKLRENNVGFAGVSMDETIDLPAMKGVEKGDVPGLDVTMEISRDALQKPLTLDETTDIPRPEGLDDLSGFEPNGDDEDDEDEDEDDVDALTKALGGDTEDDDEEDDEEDDDDSSYDEDASESGDDDDDDDDEDDDAGLEDLAGMDDDDIFAQEMARMEAPLDEISEEAIMAELPDDVLPEDEEPDDDVETGFEGGSDRKKRLLLLAAIGMISVGLLMPLRPILEKKFNPFGPTIDQVSELEPDTINETDGEVAGEPTDKTAETQSETLNEATGEPPGEMQVAENTAGQGEPTVQVDPPVVKEPATTAKNESEQVQPETVAQKDPPKEDTTPVNQEPVKDVEPDVVAQVDEPTDAESTPNGELAIPDLMEAPALTEDNEQRSPIAEGWDPATGRPRGRYQAAVNLPRKVSLYGDEAADASATIVTANEPKPKSEPKTEPKSEPKSDSVKKNTVKKPEKQTTVPKAEVPAKTPPKVVDNPAKTSPTGDAVQARALLQSGDYTRSAQMWRNVQQKNSQKYTLGLFLVCDPTNISKALSAAGADHELFILPRNLGSKDCFWVCWGAYASRRDAMMARKSLPTELKDAKGIEIYPIKSLIN